MIYFLFLILVFSTVSAYFPWSLRSVRQASGALAALSFFISVFIAFPSLTHPTMVGNLWYIDGLSGLLLVMVSFLHFTSTIVSSRYITVEYEKKMIDKKQYQLYFALLPLFILSMMIVLLSNNFGIFWMGLESTTLTTVFLVSFYKKDASLEAAWKYIILCSIGISLGLIGIFFFTYGGMESGLTASEALFFSSLKANATAFTPEVVKWGFLFFFIGIGTKVGFVPMHTWLPDAHGKTPSPISAVFSGVLLNVAFYALLRVKGIADIALGNGDWTGNFFLSFGVLSVVFVGIMLLIQNHYKRMLAFSSIEHMGLLAFSVGLGPAGMIPALMHMVGHTLAKSLLFFSSGEVFLAFHSTRFVDIKGLWNLIPKTGMIFLLGILAILAVPPGPLFASEFLMISVALKNGVVWQTLVILLSLTLVFIGMMAHTIRLLFTAGKGVRVKSEKYHESEPWNSTHIVLIVELVLLFAFGLFCLTPAGYSWFESLARSFSFTSFPV